MPCTFYHFKAQPTVALKSGNSRGDLKSSIVRTISKYIHFNFCSILNSEIPPPKDFHIDHLDSTSVNLRWTIHLGMDQIQQQFAILYGISGAESKMILTGSCCKTLTGLKRDTDYTISVRAVLPDGEESQLVSKTITTSKSTMLSCSLSYILTRYKVKGKD